MCKKQTKKVFTVNKPSPILWFPWQILVSEAMRAPIYSGPEMYTKRKLSWKQDNQHKEHGLIMKTINDQYATYIRYKVKLPTTSTNTMVLQNTIQLYHKPIHGKYPWMEVNKKLLPELTQKQWCTHVYTHSILSNTSVPGTDTHSVHLNTR